MCKLYWPEEIQFGLYTSSKCHNYLPLIHIITIHCYTKINGQASMSFSIWLTVNPIINNQRLFGLIISTSESMLLHSYISLSNNFHVACFC